MEAAIIFFIVMILSFMSGWLLRSEYDRVIAEEKLRDSIKKEAEMISKKRQWDEQKRIESELRKRRERRWIDSQRNTHSDTGKS